MRKRKQLAFYDREDNLLFVGSVREMAVYLGVKEQTIHAAMCKRDGAVCDGRLYRVEDEE